MKKSTIVSILFAILIGVFIGKYIYNGYESETKLAFNETNKEENVYLIQYGVYSSNELMIQNTKNLKDYFYYIDDNKYHVIIGITKKVELKDKIINANGIESDIYMKKICISNTEFLESLEQYDTLVSNTENEGTILTAEKQILSKYEELILNSE